MVLTTRTSLVRRRASVIVGFALAAGTVVGGGLDDETVYTGVLAGSGSTSA